MLDLVRLNRQLVRSGRAAPLYRQLVHAILDAQSRGEKTRLPSERELSASLRVARVTVRRALEILAEEGVVERRIGAGTFIVWSDRSASNEMVGALRQNPVA